MSKKQSWIKEWHRTIYELWAAGKTDYEIEAVIHLTALYIRNYRHKEGWVKQYRTVPHEALDAYLKDPANHQESGAAIAKKFECCHSMVNGKRRKLGLSLKADGVPSKTDVVIEEPTRTVNYAAQQEAYLSYLHKNFPAIKQTFPTIEAWKAHMLNHPRGVGEKLLFRTLAQYR